MRDKPCDGVPGLPHTVSQWHDLINDATVADAVLGRLVHNAQRMEPKGESLHKNNVAAG